MTAEVYPVVVRFSDCLIETGLYAKNYGEGLMMLDELFDGAFSTPGKTPTKENVISVLESLNKKYTVHYAHKHTDQHS